MNPYIGEVPPCTMGSHCLHDTGKINPTVAGGWYPQEYVCCHCGAKVTSFAGGMPMFHGPHAPKSI